MFSLNKVFYIFRFVFIDQQITTKKWKGKHRLLTMITHATTDGLNKKKYYCNSSRKLKGKA